MHSLPISSHLQTELPLKSITSLKTKQSSTTDHSTQYLQDNLDKSPLILFPNTPKSSPSTHHNILTQLNLKLNILKQKQKTIDKKFLKHIQLLQNKLSNISNEHSSLKTLSLKIKKYIKQIQSDLHVIKKNSLTIHYQHYQLPSQKQSCYFNKSPTIISKSHSRHKSIQLFKISHLNYRK